jgi:hypothetical protein
MMRNPRIIALGMLLILAASAQAQDPTDDAPPAESATPAAAGDALPVEQARLADRFKRLEQVIGQLAELSAATDPRRARLLRETIAKSRNDDISVRFEAIVKLLEAERLSAATSNQTELKQELDELLAVLLRADRDKELASQRDRVRKYLKEVSRIIRIQKAVRARTEGGDDCKGLSTDQGRVAADTSKLQSEVAKKESNKAGEENPTTDEKQKPDDNKDDPKSADDSKSENKANGDSSKSARPNSSKSQSKDSKPGDPKDSQQSNGNQSQPGQPSQDGGNPGGEQQQEQQAQQPQSPADRAAERLRRAADEMEQARKELDEAKREGAGERQQEALRALEQAKAEFERILRQLREEEMERTLASLAARCRKMLELQVAVYDGTVRANRVPQAERDQEDEIEAARLSRQESEIVHEADKALLLLREEGSSVAFPETIEQMRDDMRQVTQFLAAANVGEITQALELEIIAALEETIAALEKAIKDLKKQRGQQGPPMAGQPGDRALVDDLAELKMIRSLQMRINKRTQMYGKMMDGQQAEAQELLEALSALSERQERVHKATADLAQGRND